MRNVTSKNLILPDLTFCDYLTPTRISDFTSTDKLLPLISYVNFPANLTLFYFIGNTARNICSPGNVERHKG
jgi:hypothetical protein